MANAAMCTARKNPIGSSLIQSPQGMDTSVVGYGDWCRRGAGSYRCPYEVTRVEAPSSESRISRISIAVPTKIGVSRSV